MSLCIIIYDLLMLQHVNTHNFLFRSCALLLLKLQCCTLYLSLCWQKSKLCRILSQPENKINQQLKTAKRYFLVSSRPGADKLTFSCIKWRPSRTKLLQWKLWKTDTTCTRSEMNTFEKIQRGTWATKRGTETRN